MDVQWLMGCQMEPTLPSCLHLNTMIYTIVSRVSYNRNDLEDIREDVESLIHDNGMNNECVISSNDVSNAILLSKTTQK